MHIGLDCHGVIDKYPETFARLSRNLMAQNHSVSIITGQEWEKVKPTILKHRISYSHFFSIVDYHKELGTDMWLDQKGTWWMDNEIWLQSKGNYVQRNNIDLHFDDSYSYAKYFPSTCTFILVPKTNFHVFDEFVRNLVVV